MNLEDRKAAFALAKAEAYERSLRNHSVPTQPEPAPAPVRHHQPTVAQVEMQRSQDWCRFVDGRISAALKAHDEKLHEIIALVVAHERQLHRDAVKKLKEDFELRLAGLGDRPTAEIVDLPSPLKSRHG